MQTAEYFPRIARGCRAFGSSDTTGAGETQVDAG